MATQQGTALITGASTGIGATYAHRLAHRGHDLILVARNEAKLQALARQLATETGVNVRIVVADLTQPADTAKVEQILATDPAISVLVNNAGTATLEPLKAADVHKLEAEITLNITAPTRLSHAVLPGLLARGHGAIINIASVMSQMVQPGNTVYGGTKAYLLHFSQALAKEVEGTGVQIQAVLPGATRTEIWSKGTTPLDALPPEIVMEVDDLVDAALVGFDQKELVTIPSLPDAGDWQRLLDARNALLPNLSRNKPAARYTP
ncbi:SDR family NAD(P)-dependent oxidoreductase [Amantichitinum ursilacus]|uniref:NADP-dependent 3-hydroxy acid dehydrogenase YdfG n=1 Tax=Amantichitinum ursilacus TaxID=857265 RepID=A0A0N0XKD0_9NEIS|nr:SDR family oxidoreductase [Amantichitinum ursilacus]KPC54504.1 NADP-dependent 3-hydroxy acid dehydrogenase YdfG [Amantichitinum ursilacus]